MKYREPFPILFICGIWDEAVGMKVDGMSWAEMIRGSDGRVIHTHSRSVVVVFFLGFNIFYR